MKKTIGIILMILPAAAGWNIADVLYSSPYAPFIGAFLGFGIANAAAWGALMYVDATTDEDYAE